VENRRRGNALEALNYRGPDLDRRGRPVDKVVIPFKATPAERVTFQLLARDRGLTLSKLIRRLLHDELMKGKAKA